MSQAARLASRLHRELRMLQADPPPGVCARSCDDLLTHLEAQIEGPQGTVYSNGIFKLDIQVPERYPFEPPNIRFVTPVYHPNIDDGGRICLDILNLPPKGAWRPSLNLATLLASIGLLLTEPNPDDGLMGEIATEYKHDRLSFDLKARKWTELYANQGQETKVKVYDSRNLPKMVTDHQSGSIGGDQVLVQHEEQQPHGSERNALPKGSIPLQERNVLPKGSIPLQERTPGSFLNKRLMLDRGAPGLQQNGARKVSVSKKCTTSLRMTESEPDPNTGRDSHEAHEQVLCMRKVEKMAQSDHKKGCAIARRDEAKELVSREEGCAIARSNEANELVSGKRGKFSLEVSIKDHAPGATGTSNDSPRERTSEKSKFVSIVGSNIAIHKGSTPVSTSQKLGSRVEETQSAQQLALFTERALVDVKDVEKVESTYTHKIVTSSLLVKNDAFGRSTVTHEKVPASTNPCSMIGSASELASQSSNITIEGTRKMALCKEQAPKLCSTGGKENQAPKYLCDGALAVDNGSGKLKLLREAVGQLHPIGGSRVKNERVVPSLPRAKCLKLSRTKADLQPVSSPNGTCSKNTADRMMSAQDALPDTIIVSDSGSDDDELNEEDLGLFLSQRNLSSNKRKFGLKLK